MTTPKRVLETLAIHDPDFATFAATIPSEIVNQTTVSDELAADILSYLQNQQPELTFWLDAHSATTANADKFDLDPAAISTIAAILFLLRSRIKIEGKGFIFEHKPLGDVLLERILKTLSSLLSK